MDRPDLDTQAATAAQATARLLLGAKIQAGIAPIVDQALLATKSVMEPLETKAKLAGIDHEMLFATAFRELAAEVAYRLVFAIYESHKGHRQKLYQIVGEVCDRFSQSLEWVTSPKCDPCGATGMVNKQPCEECHGVGRFLQHGDRVGIDVNVAFAEGAPGVPEKKPDGKLWTPEKRN